MAQPYTPSGSLKRGCPGENTLCPSKRRDYASHSEAPEPLNLSDDDVDEEEEEVMEDGPYGEAQEAFPQHPAFDKMLVALDAKFVRLTKQLQKTLVDHSFVSDGLQNIKCRADAALKPPTPEHIMVAMVGATAAGKTPRSSSKSSS